MFGLYGAVSFKELLKIDNDRLEFYRSFEFIRRVGYYFRYY